MHPLVLEARRFAKEAHASIGQVRKYSGEPYDVHTLDVERRASLLYYDDPEVLAAANCHDILEDVFPVNPYYSIDLISDKFGERATSIVIDLTDVFTKENYPNKGRAERKRLEAERYGTIQAESQDIKLCDFQSNTQDIVQQDPGFAVIYLKEKQFALSYLTKADKFLLKRTVEILERAKQQLKIS